MNRAVEDVLGLVPTAERRSPACSLYVCPRKEARTTSHVLFAYCVIAHSLFLCESSKQVPWDSVLQGEAAAASILRRGSLLQRDGKHSDMPEGWLLLAGTAKAAIAPNDGTPQALDKGEEATRRAIARAAGEGARGLMRTGNTFEVFRVNPEGAVPAEKCNSSPSEDVLAAFMAIAAEECPALARASRKAGASGERGESRVRIFSPA